MPHRLAGAIAVVLAATGVLRADGPVAPRARPSDALLASVAVPSWPPAPLVIASLPEAVGVDRSGPSPLAVDVAAPIPAPAPPSPDLDALRLVFEAARRGDRAEAEVLVASLADPDARILLDWVALRDPARSFPAERYAAFLAANPAWPSGELLRRRQEEALLHDRRPPAIVREAFRTRAPETPAGRLALARALAAEGRGEEAAEHARAVYRREPLGREVEALLVKSFGEVLTPLDHRLRMRRMLAREKWDAANRAAERVGADWLKLARLYAVVAEAKSGTFPAVDALPASVKRSDAFALLRARALRRAEKLDEAAKALAAPTQDPAGRLEGDEWWTERRILARKLLDGDRAPEAYALAAAHEATSESSRIEAEFHAGWIALRFMKQPALAVPHFASAAKLAETPISVSRAAYWRARAAEAAGDAATARDFDAAAAAQGIAFYGQLSAGRLGQATSLRAVPPRAEGALAGPLKAARMLYDLGERDLALAFASDLARAAEDAPGLRALADLTAEQRDPRAMLAVGKSAVLRGLHLDAAAFPTFGVPPVAARDADVDAAMVHAIARQESAFHAGAGSQVGAQGLMQLMPDTARRTAARIGLGYDLPKLTAEPAYNAALGAAHLADLLEEWGGSYPLTFAAYNAGGGHVKRWIKAYGDPREPGVDVVDWIERIPFSETRNYVQRVMENLHVYRHLFGAAPTTLAQALARGTVRPRLEARLPPDPLGSGAVPARFAPQPVQEAAAFEPAAPMAFAPTASPLTVFAPAGAMPTVLVPRAPATAPATPTPGPTP